MRSRRRKAARWATLVVHTNTRGNEVPRRRQAWSRLHGQQLAELTLGAHILHQPLHNRLRCLLIDAVPQPGQEHCAVGEQPLAGAGPEAGAVPDTHRDEARLWPAGQLGGALRGAAAALPGVLSALRRQSGLPSELRGVRRQGCRCGFRGTLARRRVAGVGGPVLLQTVARHHGSRLQAARGAGRGGALGTRRCRRRWQGRRRPHACWARSCGLARWLFWLRLCWLLLMLLSRRSLHLLLHAGYPGCILQLG